MSKYDLRLHRGGKTVKHYGNITKYMYVEEL